MSFSNKGALVLDKKLNDTGKVTTLNPNAAEFIPSPLRSPSGSTRTENASSRFMTAGTGTQGKAVLDRSESSVSNNSDEEAHHYWRRQLPDDITPDFLVMGEDESQGANVLPFSSLSLHEGNKTSRFSPTSAGGGFLLDEQQDLSTNQLNGNSFIETMGSSSSSFLRLPTKPWDKKVVNNDQLLTSVVDGHPYAGNSTQTYVNNILNEQSFSESMDMNPLEFLASQFPGFAAESLAELHFANGGDLNLTIEMLTQLELQVDGGLNQNFDSKALSAPNFGALDFPALSTPDGQNGLPKFSRDDLQQSLNPYQSSDKDNMLSFKSNSSISSRGAIDFAAAVKKAASQDSAMWKYDRNGSANASVGSSRSSHVLASSYSGGQGRGIYGDKLQTRGSARAAPVWLETGDSVANMYSEMREEARDYARLRNAYFEQARQAYLVGNKALAKELSVKGQLHNMQMKAAHEKAQESIYRQRNPSSSDMKGGNMRGQEKIIDLHGLHVSEAIHVLKRELTVLRSAARSAHQRLQVYICVGTGHHTRGSRTPARLPIAVQHYLLDEEGLDYSEPQPGLLRVVIY